MEVLDQVKAMLMPILEGTDIFLVSIKIKPTNNIKIYLDADDGFPISKSSSVNRALRKQIDESNMFADGDYSLEVSSPGVDEPLVLQRQYVKNIGRKIEITQNDDTVVTGKLSSADETGVTLDVQLNAKSKETTSKTISFDDIKQAIIQISF